MAHILKQRRVWSAVLDVPKDVRSVFGKARFKHTLKTESETEAEYLSGPFIKEWKTAIKLAREGRVGDALALEESVGRPAFTSQDQLEGYQEHVLLPEAESLEDRVGLEHAKRFYDITSGAKGNLTHHVEDWLKYKAIGEKQEDMYRSDLIKLEETHKFTDEIDRKAAKEYVRKLLEDASPKTVKRKLSVFRGYWGWLAEFDVIPEEKSFIWNDIKLPKHKEEETRPLTEDGLERIVKRIHQLGDTDLLKLTVLAMYTGARIDELTSLKAEDISEGHLEIREAKTDAGERMVPLHPYIEPLVKQMISESSDGYLLSGQPRNKYGDRSNAIGKRFGRVKKSLGFADRVETFHSIRGTVAQKLKNAKIEEFIAADILGHEYRTMTYGVYAGGVDLEVKREALDKVRYSFDMPPVQ